MLRRNRSDNEAERQKPTRHHAIWLQRAYARGLLSLGSNQRSARFNPHNIAGILAVRQEFGSKVPQVAVFDTAFHQRIPEPAYLYAIPYRFYQQYRIRRYGFHGTMSLSVSRSEPEANRRPLPPLLYSEAASVCSEVTAIKIHFAHPEKGFNSINEVINRMLLWRSKFYSPLMITSPEFTCRTRTT